MTGRTRLRSREERATLPARPAVSALGPRVTPRDQGCPTPARRFRCLRRGSRPVPLHHRRVHIRLRERHLLELSLHEQLRLIAVVRRARPRALPVREHAQGPWHLPELDRQDPSIAPARGELAVGLLLELQHPEAAEVAAAAPHRQVLPPPPPPRTPPPPHVEPAPLALYVRGRGRGRGHR